MVTAAFPVPWVLVEVPVEGLVIRVLPRVYAERIEPMRRLDH
jgi:hypothetical protein